MILACGAPSLSGGLVALVRISRVDQRRILAVSSHPGDALVGALACR
jgi:hypothetical protein